MNHDVEGDTWEERMAARHRQREVQREEERLAGVEPVERNVPQPWLNGWPRVDDGKRVFIGCGLHCVCCGATLGSTSVVFSEDYEEPGENPQWPFGFDDCPLGPHQSAVPLTVSQLPPGWIVSYLDEGFPTVLWGSRSNTPTGWSEQ